MYIFYYQEDQCARTWSRLLSRASPAFLPPTRLIPHLLDRRWRWNDALSLGILSKSPPQCWRNRRVKSIYSCRQGDLDHETCTSRGTLGRSDPLDDTCRSDIQEVRHHAGYKCTATTAWEKSRCMAVHFTAIFHSLPMRSRRKFKPFSAIVQHPRSRASKLSKPKLARSIMDNFIHANTQQQSEWLRCQKTSQLEEATQLSPQPAAGWAPWRRARPRIVIIDVDSTGSLGPAAEFSSLNLLRAHLQQRRRSDDIPMRSIYLLEALSRDFITILEQHFQLHPALFTDHERLVDFNNRATGEGGGVSFLPSAMHGRDYVSFKYHEPLLMCPQPTEFRNLCDVSGRHIAVTRSMGKFSEVGVARRKCTFWSRVEDHGGWDCKLLPTFYNDFGRD
jgi:hypothetical protein